MCIVCVCVYLLCESLFTENCFLLGVGYNKLALAEPKEKGKNP